jgi:tape measure domain-containing protein
MSTTIGTIELIARIDTSQYKKGAKDINEANKSLEASSSEASDKATGAFVGVAKVGLAAVATAAVAVGALLVKNIDNAIKRVDTLNNSNRTFENMGFAAQSVSTVMADLTKSIQGLPTPLDEAVKGVQLLAASSNDLPKSQRLFSALNNAIIGFGGTTADVSNAVRQLSQDLAGGRLQAETWNSLLDSGLGPTLAAIARQMGKTTKQLKDGLSDGSVSISTFTDSLISMNEKGGGGLKSLQQIAKDATSGIGTGWANLNTAITRGLATILKAIGPENISGAITSFGSSMEGALKSFSNFIPSIINGLRQVGDYLTPKLEVLGATIRNDVLPAIQNFAKAFGPTLGAGLVGLMGLAIDALNVFLTVLTPVLGYLSENTWIVWAFVGALVAVNTALAINGAVKGFMASLALMNAAMTTSTGVAGVLRFALLGVIGPWQIALAIIGVAAVVAGIKEIVQWLDTLLDKFQKTNSQSVKINGQNVSGSRGSGLSIVQQIKGAFGARAEGGPVTSGRPYIVGEEGPELFTPNTSGNILPNDKSMQLASNQNTGGSPIVFNLHLDGVLARSRSDLRDIGKDIIKSVNEELVAKGKTPIGGGAI